MWHYLLVEIPQLLFEPLAVLGVLGMIFAFIRNIRKHDINFLLIVLLLFFMLGWRLACNNLMLSSRYASILLYPVILFVAWFAFQLDDIIRLLFHNFFLKKKSILLSYLCIVCMCVICFFKILHYNPHAENLINACQVLKQDSIGKCYKVCTSLARERIAYYTQTPRLKILSKEDDYAYFNLSDKAFLKNTIHSLINSFEPLYCIFYLKKGEDCPSAESLGISSSMGSWEILYREYTSRKKNKEIILARFIPGHPNVEKWHSPVLSQNNNNICKNGDFEQILSGSDLQTRLSYYKTIDVDPKYFNGEFSVPKDWWLGLSGKIPKIFLSDDNPIADNYSLFINSGNTTGVGINSANIAKRDGLYSGYVRGGEDSVVFIRICYSNNKGIQVVKEICFTAEKDILYRFSLPSLENDFPENVSQTYLIIAVVGSVFIDNVEFVPIYDNILSKKNLQ